MEMHQVINTLISRYEEDIPHTIYNRRNIEWELSLHLEKEGDFVIFERHHFDLMSEENFEDCAYFRNPYIALISDTSLVKYLAKVVFEKQKVKEFLEIHDCDLLDTISNDNDENQKLIEIDYMYHPKKVVISKTIAHEYSLMEFQKDCLSNDLLTALISFTKRAFNYIGGNIYIDCDYYKTPKEDPRQLKLF